MSSAYQQLLDATIQHLQELKTQGVRYVNLPSQTLTALCASCRPPDFEKANHSIGRPDAHHAPTSGAHSCPPPIPAAVPSGDKTQAMSALRQRALACEKCSHLVATRKNVVFGVGSIEADLMFVGEAPGADEDVQGEPFVGRAGQLLTKIIQTMGLSRQSVYIANILKCRPDTPGQRHGNRAPTEEEMETCIAWLIEQIDIIQPRVLVALGGTALKGLLGTAAGITRLRGTWQTFHGIPVMPTFHPSFLLRPENAAKKRLVWEDMLQVMEKLGLPISEKQRGYFLKT